MEFTQWTGIAALVVALVVSGVLIYLYSQGKLSSGSISGFGALIDKLTQVLQELGQSDSIVGVLAVYAAKAVRVVEQMVKNGELEKENTVRKNAAKVIVEQLALADGVDVSLIYDNERTIDTLIEAAVHEMQNTGLNISFGEPVEEGELTELS